MYRFDLEGYAYGQGVPLDLVWTGYSYTNEPTFLTHTCEYNRNRDLIDLKLNQYFKGDKLVISFGPINRYCNGFSLYYQAHYNN